MSEASGIFDPGPIHYGHVASCPYLLCSMRVGLLFSCALALLTTPSHAQTANVDDMLTWSSAMGTRMYSYFQAQQRAMEVIEEQTGATEMPPLHAATSTDDGWIISFGHLDGEDAYLIRYGLVVRDDGSTDSFSHFEERYEASASHTRRARALDAVIDTFQIRLRTDPSFEASRYRVAVIPFPRGQLSAFVSPSQTDGSTIQMGNDVMYRLNRDDATIEDVLRFHHRLISVPLDSSTDLSEEAGMPALLVPDAPFPSPVDVLHAMERNTSIVVLTKHGVVTIRENGDIEAVPDDDPLAEALYDHVE